MTSREIFEKLEKIPDERLVEIPGGERTPKLLLDSQRGLIKITGRSLPENSNIFYKPILAWIDKYINNPKDETHVVFDLEYYNSSSSKMILEVFKKLSNLNQHGKHVFVDWYYLEGDDDMLDSGKTFEELTEINFDFICYV